MRPELIEQRIKAERKVAFINGLGVGLLALFIYFVLNAFYLLYFVMPLL